VKIYVGLYRAIGLELSQGRKWRKQKFAHYTARAVACDLHSGLERLTWATAVTADIRNFLQIFHTNSNRCFRLRIKPSFFPLSNQDDGSSSNTCIREAAGSNLLWGAVCPEGSVEFSTPAVKFFMLCYSILNLHQFRIHYYKDNNEQIERRQTN